MNHRYLKIIIFLFFGIHFSIVALGVPFIERRATGYGDHVSKLGPCAIEVLRLSVPNFVIQAEKAAKFIDAAIQYELELSTVDQGRAAAWAKARRRQEIKPSMEAIIKIIEGDRDVLEALTSGDPEIIELAANLHMGEFLTSWGIVGPSTTAPRAVQNRYIRLQQESNLIRLYGKMMNGPKMKVGEGGLFLFRWSKYLPEHDGLNVGAFSFSLNPNLVKEGKYELKKDQVDAPFVLFVSEGAELIPFMTQNGLEEVLLINPTVNMMGEKAGYVP